MYTVTGTNSSSGCQGTDSIYVKIRSLPNVNAGSDITLCEFDFDTIHARSFFLFMVSKYGY